MTSRCENRVEVLRRRRLVRRCEKAGVDVLLVTARANVRYLSGFSGEDSFLLVGRGWSVLLTDSRFAEQARRQCPNIEHTIRTGPMAPAIRAALRGRNARRIGVETENMTLGMFDRLSRAISAKRLRRTRHLVLAMRERKDAVEVAAIRRALRVAQGAFRGLIAGGSKALVGRSEAALAGELDHRMRQLGAEAAAFATIVAAGPNAALPHYEPGRTRIRAGQAILIDWGASVSGYCSDLTRVVFTGRIPPQVGRLYEVVLRAHAAGVSAVRAGRSGKAVDAAAREVIAAAGYGQQFGHGLGHGIGLEVHEGPALSRRVGQRLVSGNVVTVEPGVYVPGVGGVRIEDDVLVEAGRGRVLSSLPRDARAMVLK